MQRPATLLGACGHARVLYQHLIASLTEPEPGLVSCAGRESCPGRDHVAAAADAAPFTKDC